MARGNKTTEFLKECLSDALIQLMREKDFEKISIKEIADTAGVGRATWFRLSSYRYGIGGQMNTLSLFATDLILLMPRTFFNLIMRLSIF